MYVYEKNIIWANLLSNPLLFVVLWAENFEIYLATLSEEPEKRSSYLSEEVRRSLLDDTFWHESKAIVSLL